MQARLALQHGKRVFLLRHLVTEQPWARSYIGRGATEVADVSDILGLLAEPERIRLLEHGRRQLVLDLV